MWYICFSCYDFIVIYPQNFCWQFRLLQVGNMGKWLTELKVMDTGRHRYCMNTVVYLLEGVDISSRCLIVKVLDLYIAESHK